MADIVVCVGYLHVGKIEDRQLSLWIL